LIHSLDRWALAEEIQRRAAEQDRRVPVLVQLNVAGETTKQGLAVNEAADFVREVSKLTALQVCGLMTIAPMVGNAEEVRPVFRELRLVAENLHKMQVPGVTMKYLSMGMSNDYRVAVEEGANLLRLGTVLFGVRA
jgi:pyridoxal phosphate enzyme (YggS family)